MAWSGCLAACWAPLSPPVWRDDEKEKGEAGFPFPLQNPIWVCRVNRNRRTKLCVHLLFGGLRHRNNRDVDAALGFGTERNMTLGQCEESVIRAHADIGAGMPLGSALAYDDIAGKHGFAAKRLHAKAFTRRVTSVAG